MMAVTVLAEVRLIIEIFCGCTASFGIAMFETNVEKNRRKEIRDAFWWKEEWVDEVGCD
jgi:hypothetical protein